MYVSNVATGMQAGWLNVQSPGHMVRLSGWVRDQNFFGIEYPNITMDISTRVRAMPLPGFQERADRALWVIARRAGNDVETVLSVEFLAKYLELLGRSYSTNYKESMTLIRILESEGSLRATGMGIQALSVKGLLKVEAMSGRSTASAQGFVAMWFDDSLNHAWINGFDPAIRAAGFEPFRIDKKDYVGGISDEIVAEIRRSRFVVADYTGQANGVYFEAGFALGLGLTVIPTCRADEVSKLHFDIKHINTLLWHDRQNSLTRWEDVFGRS
jgi:hypothetical protein